MSLELHGCDNGYIPYMWNIKEEESQRRERSTRFTFLSMFEQQEGIEPTKHFNVYYDCILDNTALVLFFLPYELIISPWLILIYAKVEAQTLFWCAPYIHNVHSSLSIQYGPVYSGSSFIMSFSLVESTLMPASLISDWRFI